MLTGRLNSLVSSHSPRLAWSLVAGFDPTSFPRSSPTRPLEGGCFWSSLRDARQPEVDYLHSWAVVLPIELLAKRLHKKKTPGNTNLVPRRLDLRRSKTPLRGSLRASSPVELGCRGGKRGRTTSYPSFFAPPPERPGEISRRLLRSNPEEEARERPNPYCIPILVLRFAINFKKWTVKCNVAICIS